MLDSNAAVRTFYDIDTPITVAALRERGACDYLRADQLSGLDVYFSFTGGPMLDELQSRFGVRRAVPLYCSFDPERYRTYPRSPRFACAMSYMGTYAPDRQPKLEEFLFRRRPRAAARCASSWPGRSIRADVQWPRNVRHIVHLNPRWHPHLYSSSRLTLNVTRRDMVMAGYSPSVRLFEAAACGGRHRQRQLAGTRQLLSARARDPSAGQRDGDRALSARCRRRRIARHRAGRAGASAGGAHQPAARPGVRARSGSRARSAPVAIEFRGSCDMRMNCCVS